MDNKNYRKKPFFSGSGRVISLLRAIGLVFILALTNCGDGDIPSNGEPETTTFTIQNQQEGEVTVYITFGAKSCVRPDAWSSFCIMTNSGNCNFNLEGEGTENDSRVLPLTTREPNCTDNFGNFTIAFNAPPSQTCNKTLAEVNFDISGLDNYDISLVNGFNEPMNIEVSPGMNAGPVTSMDGNQEVLGVFPLGCDVCTERKDPPLPCGYNLMDNTQCKMPQGTQDPPDVACILKQPTGGSITINLLK